MQKIFTAELIRCYVTVCKYRPCLYQCLSRKYCRHAPVIILLQRHIKHTINHRDAWRTAVTRDGNSIMCNRLESMHRSLNEVAADGIFLDR